MLMLFKFNPDREWERRYGSSPDFSLLISCIQSMALRLIFPLKLTPGLEPCLCMGVTTKPLPSSQGVGHSPTRPLDCDSPVHTVHGWAQASVSGRGTVTMFECCLMCTLQLRFQVGNCSLSGLTNVAHLGMSIYVLYGG